MNKPRKSRLFVENMLIYGLGGIISKALPIIMIPIVTRLMPDSSYFGLSDLTTTVVSFAQAIALMGMYDAMYRMFFEREEVEYKKNVCSTAFIFAVFSSTVVFLVLLMSKEWISEWVFKDSQYTYLVYLCAISVFIGTTNSIVSAPTRMLNRKKVFLVINTFGPIMSYAIAIPLILKGFYVIALPLAGVLSCLILEVAFGVLNRKWFSFRYFNKIILKQLLAIAVPVTPSFLIYWVFNSCDKLMIANIIGVAAAGIYAVGAKLGHASQLIYIAFSGGWQYFAFSTMKDENQVKTNSCIFEYLGVISFAITAFVCAWSYPICRVLFSGDYVDGYIVSPYLFLAPLLQMLFQVAGTQLWTIKKPWPNMLFLLAGAIFNICLNCILIPIIGIEGAAISTLLGYALSLTLSVSVLSRMKLMILTKRIAVATVIQIVYMGIWRLFLQKMVFISTTLAVLITIVYIFLYRDDLKRLVAEFIDRN